MREEKGDPKFGFFAYHLPETKFVDITAPGSSHNRSSPLSRTATKMRMATVCAVLLAASTRASPIETRQFGPATGSMSLYSEAGRHDTSALAEDVAITDGCTNLDEPAARSSFMAVLEMAWFG